MPYACYLGFFKELINFLKPSKMHYKNVSNLLLSLLLLNKEMTLHYLHSPCISLLSGSSVAVKAASTFLRWAGWPPRFISRLMLKPRWHEAYIIPGDFDGRKWVLPFVQCRNIINFVLFSSIVWKSFKEQL